MTSSFLSNKALLDVRLIILFTSDTFPSKINSDLSINQYKIFDFIMVLSLLKSFISTFPFNSKNLLLSNFALSEFTLYLTSSLS